MQLFHLWTHGQLNCARNMMRAHTRLLIVKFAMVKPFSGQYKHIYVQHTHTHLHLHIACVHVFAHVFFCTYGVHEKNVLYTICVFELAEEGATSKGTWELIMFVSCGPKTDEACAYWGEP